jgi:guanylate kinase
MGESGCGKSSIEYMLEVCGYMRSISYTTRKPRVNNGKAEINGVDYNFVSRAEFMRLVESEKMAEFAVVHGEFYGTPRIYGGSKHVAVVDPNGFKSLKEIYGNQVIGVYLDCDNRLRSERLRLRGESLQEIQERQEKEKEMFNAIRERADIVVDANKDQNVILADILQFVNSRKVI